MSTTHDTRTVTRATRDLTHGDRVLLSSGLVRTVDHVTDSGYLNYRGERILAVIYQEPESEEWSRGNSSNETGLWNLLPSDHTRCSVHIPDGSAAFGYRYCEAPAQLMPWIGAGIAVCPDHQMDQSISIISGNGTTTVEVSR